MRRPRSGSAAAWFPSHPFWFWVAIVLPLVAAVCSCAGRRHSEADDITGALVRVNPERCPVFADDMDYDGLSHAIARSRDYLEKLPSDRSFTFGADIYTADDMIRSLDVFHEFVRNRPSPEALNDFLRKRFIVYRCAGEKDTKKVLFTGYFEPILSGRLEPDDTFRYPVYARPSDHTQIRLSQFGVKTARDTIVGRYTNGTVVPYWDREAIENGGRLSDEKPLAWVKDRIGLFFLHVQGSGRIFLQNGESFHVQYHTTNGQVYRSIGKLLIEKGKVPKSEMSMQRIRAYLENHPRQIDEILNYNPSYVFFSRQTDGPAGCLGVKLTPGRSIAVDRRLLPLSGLAFARFSKPLLDAAGNICEWTVASRFVLPQDTGGAIRGPGRADLFWGNGPYAEMAAGHMQHRGELFFMMLKPSEKPVPPPVAVLDTGDQRK